MSGAKNFSDYKVDGHNWITLANGEYYPDILVDAVKLYEPVLVIFKQLLERSESSETLFKNIADIKPQWIRMVPDRLTLAWLRGE